MIVLTFRFATGGVWDDWCFCSITRDRDEHSSLQSYIWTRYVAFKFFYVTLFIMFMYLLVCLMSFCHPSGFIGDTPVFLAKPQTYMNLSGESVCNQSFFSFSLFSWSLIFIILSCLFILVSRCFMRLST